MQHTDAPFGRRVLEQRPDLLQVKPAAARPIQAATRQKIAREHAARGQSMRGLVFAIASAGFLAGFMVAVGLYVYMRPITAAFDRKADAHLLTELAECALGPAWAHAYPALGAARQPGGTP